MKIQFISSSLKRRDSPLRRTEEMMLPCKITNLHTIKLQMSRNISSNVRKIFAFCLPHSLTHPPLSIGRTLEIERIKMVEWKIVQHFEGFCWWACREWSANILDWSLNDIVKCFSGLFHLDVWSKNIWIFTLIKWEANLQAKLSSIGLSKLSRCQPFLFPPTLHLIWISSSGVRVRSVFKILDIAYAPHMMLNNIM